MDNRIYMPSDRDFLATLVRMVSKNTIINVSLDLHHQLMQYYNQQRIDRAKLIDDVATEVLKRISVSVDASDAVSKIKLLKAELDSLGR